MSSEGGDGEYWRTAKSTWTGCATMMDCSNGIVVQANSTDEFPPCRNSVVLCSAAIVVLQQSVDFNLLTAGKSAFGFATQQSRAEDLPVVIGHDAMTTGKPTLKRQNIVASKSAPAL